MSDFKSYRDHSRTNWGRSDGQAPTLDQINTGTLQRIADGVEKMAAHHATLIRERDYWERRALEAEKREATARRRIVALRGVITRQQRKAAPPVAGEVTP